MTTTLALAARLRALPDAELVGALHERGYRRQGVSDFFDLAEALLDADSLQRALSALDRVRLATLVVLGRAGAGRDAGEVAAALAEQPAASGTTEQDARAALEAVAALLLAHPDDGRFAVYDAVTARLEAWPESGLPSPADLLATPPPPALAAVPDTEQRFTDRLAAERAFEAVAAVSELVAELSREGARELQKGGLALPATKRLAEALAIDPAAVPTALSVAARAGLVAIGDGMWLPTESAWAWQHSPTSDRWRALAAAWKAALPDDLRSLLAGRSRAAWGDSLRQHVAWLYPAAVETAQERVDAHTRDAEWLGITARQAPSSAGTALVERDAEAAAEIVAGQFPAEVDKVYLQHDLTVVSPGPLAPEVESRLRGMADLESRALASTFRFSGASVDRAITAGETADGIRAFLAAVSLTGIPQPLDYLIADAAERHGRVRVREAKGAEDGPVDGVRSVVRSSDATLLRTIQVDQSLAPLRLTRSADDELTSRFPRDVVFWALSDARYPVVAEDADGEPVALRRLRTARAAAPGGRDQDAELVARLRETDTAAGGGEHDAAQWLARQLDAAVRARQPVIVEVRMPDGRTVDYLLEPTGVGGGRLRGRDRAADIERTLPLSSVTGLRSVD
ncbi:MAG: helicase-associated domain-containing protein [Leifsonia sp.]|uniref:helicase-associated domain-containing protein n=1 Tax=Leifsonia sp. TaxID=1870902 RepID=UPI003F808EE4